MYLCNLGADRHVKVNFGQNIVIYHARTFRRRNKCDTFKYSSRIILAARAGDVRSSSANRRMIPASSPS